MSEFASPAVFEYIYAECQRQNIFVNLTKLEKLLYCCYGVILVRFGKRLTDEHPEAWESGPIFPKTLDFFHNRKPHLPLTSGFLRACPPEWKLAIKETIEVFGKYSPVQLASWSHRKDSPWAKAVQRGDLVPSCLDDFEIHCFFKNHVFKRQ